MDAKSSISSLDRPAGITTVGIGNFPERWPANKETSGPGLS